MRNPVTRLRAPAIGGAAVIVALLIALVVIVRSGDDAGPAGAGPAATGSTAGTPPAPRAPAVSAALPRVPGYRVAAVGLRSYRLSLVFRLRNTILNSVEGAASDYSVATATAKRAGRTALLIDVAAAPGASPPAIPADLARVIGIAPWIREVASGLPVSVVRGPAYSLGVVDGGPRRGVVAIATRPAEALALTRSVARALAREG